jgi:hypothetical protein
VSADDEVAFEHPACAATLHETGVVGRAVGALDVVNVVGPRDPWILIVPAIDIGNWASLIGLVTMMRRLFRRG